MTPGTASILELCRLYVALALVGAAAGKAGDVGGFRDTIAGLLPMAERHSKAVALAVIGAEALTALLVLAGASWARAGMAIAMALFIAFAAVLSVALVQRKSISCNCFGGRSHIISAYDLLRNATLIGACGAYLCVGPPGASFDIAAELLLLGSALILLLVSASLDDIARLSRRA